MKGKKCELIFVEIDSSTTAIFIKVEMEKGAVFKKSIKVDTPVIQSVSDVLQHGGKIEVFEIHIPYLPKSTGEAFIDSLLQIFS